MFLSEFLLRRSLLPSECRISMIFLYDFQIKHFLRWTLFLSLVLEKVYWCVCKWCVCKSGKVFTGWRAFIASEEDVLWGKWSKGVLAETITESTMAVGCLRLWRWWRGAGSALQLLSLSLLTPLYMSLLGFSMMLCMVLSKTAYNVGKMIAELFPAYGTKFTGIRKICPWNTGPSRDWLFTIKVCPATWFFLPRRVRWQSKKRKHKASSLERMDTWINKWLEGWLAGWMSRMNQWRMMVNILAAPVSMRSKFFALSVLQW